MVELSTREQEVLEQLAEGLSYTAIANNLFLSSSTVRKHIENIYKNSKCITSWRPCKKLDAKAFFKDTFKTGIFITLGGFKMKDKSGLRARCPLNLPAGRQEIIFDL